MRKLNIILLIVTATMLVVFQVSPAETTLEMVRIVKGVVISFMTHYKVALIITSSILISSFLLFLGLGIFGIIQAFKICKYIPEPE